MLNNGFRQQDEVKFNEAFCATTDDPQWYRSAVFVIEYFGTDNTLETPKRFAMLRLKRNSRQTRLAYLDDLTKV